jgi:hypothetical protein
MTLTDALARSFFDLWHHLDPAAAGRFDPAGPPPLAAFDRRTVRQHLAALRALGGAAEALSPASLDEEIDQTLLLEAVRGVEHEFADEARRPGDPAFWASRLCEVVAARPGDPAVLADIPAWAEAAEGSLRRPPAFGLDLGLELLAWVERALEAPEWQALAADDRARARAALGSLRLALRDAAPAPDALASGVGDEAVDRRLHHGCMLGVGGVEGLRQLARMAARLEPEAALAPAAEPAALPGPGFRALTEPGAWIAWAPGGALEAGALRIARGGPQAAAVIEARYGPAGAAGLLGGRGDAAAEIRRRYATPSLVEGWALYAEARVAREVPDAGARRLLAADLHRRVLAAAIDLALHRRQMPPAEALDRLTERLPPEAALVEVRRIVLRPLEAAGSVLVWREWERLESAWPGGPDAMREAVLAGGLLSPALARWRHGVDG